MSRTLRRPMFRGGRVSAYGTGIASGLADGGAIGGGNIVGTKMADGRYGFASPEFKSGWNRIWGNPKVNVGSGTPITPTGGQTVAGAADKVSKWSKARNLLSSPKISEQGIYEALKKWGPKAMNWGKGIVGAGIKRFPAVTSALAMEYLTRPGEVDELVYEAEEYGPIEGRLHKILDPTYASKWVEHAEEYYPAKRLEEKMGEDPVTGIEGPPGGGDPDMYAEKEVSPETGEPVELTAKEMVAENKKLFAELLGSKKARGQDISEMLLGFAGAEGDTTMDKFQKFAAAEAKRPGKLEKINETAAALAINDYIAGKRSLENLKQTLGVVDYKIKASIEASQLKGGPANWLSDLDKEATSQKGGVTDLGVIRSVLFKTTGQNVSVISKDKKNLEDIDMDDLNIGFNIVSHKGGKTILEKFENGTVKERTDLPIT